MAKELQLFDRSYIAAADLSSSQFCAVALDNTGKVNLPSAGAKIIGVLQNKPKSGQVADVRVLGVTKMVAGTGGVTAGDALKANSDGTALTATSGTYQIGFAESTAAAGAYATAILLPSGKQ
jgi:hypothetical protein